MRAASLTYPIVMMIIGIALIAYTVSGAQASRLPGNTVVRTQNVAMHPAERWWKYRGEWMHLRPPAWCQYNTKAKPESCATLWTVGFLLSALGVMLTVLRAFWALTVEAQSDPIRSDTD